MAKNLNIECLEEGDTIRVTLQGHLDSSNAESLRSQLLALPSHGQAKEYRFDLKGLDFLTSAGLRVLLALKKAGYDITLCSPNEVVQEVFTVTGLDKIFTLQESP